jgi:hypothetical protein
MDRFPFELLRTVTLPHIPLKPSSHSVHRNVVSDNHVTSFGSDRRLGLVVVDQSQMEGNSTVGRERGKLERSNPHRTRNFFPWPQHSSGMHDVFRIVIPVESIVFWDVKPCSPENQNRFLSFLASGIRGWTLTYGFGLRVLVWLNVGGFQTFRQIFHSPSSEIKHRIDIDEE